MKHPDPDWLLDRGDFDVAYQYIRNNTGRRILSHMQLHLDSALDFILTEEELDKRYPHQNNFDLLFDLANNGCYEDDLPVITNEHVEAMTYLHGLLTPNVYEYPRSKPITLRIT